MINSHFGFTESVVSLGSRQRGRSKVFCDWGGSIIASAQSTSLVGGSGSILPPKISNFEPVMRYVSLKNRPRL